MNWSRNIIEQFMKSYSYKTIKIIEFPPRGKIQFFNIT